MRGERTLLNFSVAYFVWLLVVWLVFGYTPTNDGEGYLELARVCLAEGQPYPTISLIHYDDLPFIWNIGIINLTALSLLLSNSIIPLLLLMCLMKAGTAWLVGQVSCKLFNHKTAVIAILLYILYPNNWGQSTMISSEIPSDFFSLLAVFLFIKAVSSNIPSWKENKKLLILSGLVLAFGNWFRPTATIMVLALAVYAIVTLKKESWRPFLLMLGGYISFIIVVGSSTYMRTGHFVYQARSLWFSMVDECYDGAEVAPHWGQPIWPEGYPRYIEGHEQLDCFECERIWQERSMDWLKNHKVEYLKKIPGRIYYMYQSDYDNLPVFLSHKEHAEDNYITLPFRHLLSEASTLSFAQWMALFTMIFYGLLLLMAAMGIIRLTLQGEFQKLALPLFIIVGGTLILTLVMHGETRFKSPFMPWIFIMAATFLAMKNWKNKAFTQLFGKKTNLSVLLLLLSSSVQAEDIHSKISALGLPVLSITTVNGEEPTCDYAFAPEGAFGITTTNNTKVPGRCVLTLLGDTLFDSGEYLKDQSGMTLKIRGNTSAYYSEKKPFKLKLEKKNDLLNRGDSSYYDKNWVLLTEGDVLYTLFGNKVNELVGMPWTPAMQYLNLIVNNDYRGIYLLIEQVKRNADCRINVDKKTGYLIERDAYWWNEDLFFKTDKENKEFTFKYPEPEDITPEQLEYITNYLNNFETAIDYGNFEEYIDLNSWASWLLAHDILGTRDSGGSNLYLTKYDNSDETLLQMSTLWDFGSIMSHKDKWSRIHTDNYFYYNRLFNNDNNSFSDVYVERYKELSAFIFERLSAFLDDFEQSSTAQAIQRSRPLEYARWGDYDNTSVQQNIEEMRQWLLQREKWMNEAILSIPTSSTIDISTKQTTTRQQPVNLLGQPVDEHSYRGIIIKNGKKIIYNP